MWRSPCTSNKLLCGVAVNLRGLEGHIDAGVENAAQLLVGVDLRAVHVAIISQPPADVWA